MRSTGRVSPVTGFVDNINIFMRLLRKILNLFILILDAGLKVTKSRLEQLGQIHDLNIGIPTPR